MEPVLSPPAQDDRPALRLDSGLYLARPIDAAESTARAVRRPVEPAAGFLEDDGGSGFSGARAVWIPNGMRVQEEPPQSAVGATHRTNQQVAPQLPAARASTVFDSPFSGDPHSRDCARLVTRIMLAQAQRESSHRQYSDVGVSRGGGDAPRHPRGEVTAASGV